MRRTALVVAAGAALPFSLAPFDIWPLAVLSLAVLFHELKVCRRGALTGWLYGFGLYAAGASWIYVSINEHGNAPPPLAALLVALFAAGMALFYALGGAIFVRFRPHRWDAAAVFFVAVISFTWWLLTWLLTGFPWLYPGYALLDTPAAGLAPLGGVLLLNLLAAAGAAALVVALRDWRAGTLGRGRLLACAVVVVLPWLAGAAVGGVSWSQGTGTHSVALVQGNVDQSEKWLPQNRVPILERYLGLSEPHWGVATMVWPEAAITIFEHEAGAVLETLDATARRSGTGLVLGIPAYEQLADGRVVFRNTAIGLGAAEGRYVKRRLVPFGEYVPLESVLRGLIEFFDLPMSRAEPGPERQPPLDLGGAARAQMAICYEIVYPVRVRTPVTDVLLTISNDTWFGASIGPHQHLQMARMRALENARYVLRGTNNGVTAIIGPDGAIRGRLPQFEAGVLLGEYQTMQGLTPFARFGSWPFLLLMAALGGAGLALRKRPE